MRRIWRNLRLFYGLIADPLITRSHFPNEPRKSAARRVADQLVWLLRHREINIYYYSWGLDRKHGPRPGSLMSYRQFQQLRDRRNRSRAPGRRGHVAVLADKRRFASFLAERGHPTPRIVAVADGTTVQWIEPRRTASLGSLLEVDGGLDLFCKPARGEQGRNVFRLQVRDRELLIDGAPATLRQLAARLAGRTVLQERVRQHPALAAMYPACLNTVRLVTVHTGDGVRPFSYPSLRTGVGGSVVDNWSAGGIQTVVDPRSGRVRGPGRLFRGGTVDSHPDTGVEFDGFQIPHWREAVDVAVRVHQDLPGWHSVGWDLAIAESGPLVVEGNSRWTGGLRMGLDPDFKREFTRLFADD